MNGSLTYSGTTLSLPQDLAWPNEFDWLPVVQRKEWGVTGAMFVDQGVKLAGREIVLSSLGDGGFFSRLQVAQLHTWAALPNATFTLSLRGVSYQVIFDHERGALEHEQVMYWSNPDPDDWCRATVRFVTI